MSATHNEKNFKASVDRYICIELDEETTKPLAAAVEKLPGAPIKKLHVTIVHSLDAAKNTEAMKMWNDAIKLVGEEETVKVMRFKQEPGVLTAAEAILRPELADLVASRVPHISLRLEKGHKAVESRYTLSNEKVPMQTFENEFVLKGKIKMMGRA